MSPTTEPEQMEYLYFVAKRDGRTHTFSRTYDEHRKAIGR
jgi:cell division protein YceG involved in septum cleavage